MHRFTLGDFELSIFSDGDYYLDGGALFGVVPKTLWQRRMQADEKNRIAVGMNSLLVRTGANTVLIETGMGNKLGEKMSEIYCPKSQLLDNLSAGGVAPEDIDTVVNTHLHFDHCGWNTVRKNGRAVPTLVVPAIGGPHPRVACLMATPMPGSIGCFRVHRACRAGA